MGAKLPGQRSPRRESGEEAREGRPQLCQHRTVEGSKGWVAWSTDVNRYSVVTVGKPKVLGGLGQKGEWPGTGALTSPVADGVPPAYRRDLNYPGA